MSLKIMNMRQFRMKVENKFNFDFCMYVWSLTKEGDLLIIWG